jgi:hypothetical protein
MEKKQHESDERLFVLLAAATLVVFAVVLAVILVP